MGKVNFSDDFKRDAVRQMTERGYPVAEVSQRDNHPEEGVALARLGLVASEQVIFNMFEQPPRGALFPAAIEGDTAIIARVPLDAGTLAGNWTAGS